MREKLNSKKGFTLAELLIVVAIIAVLMAIMIPVFGNSRANAILAKDAANLRSIFSEAVSSEMSNTDNYDSKGILYVDITDYLNDFEGEFDKGTSATYEKKSGSNPHGKITIEHSKTDNTEEILLDDDLRLGTVSSGTGSDISPKKFIANGESKLS